MNAFSQLWKKLAKSKKYREEFVAAQVKRGIPFQIRTLLKRAGISQEELANRAGLTQGVVSRAANPDYGNLTLNTIVRIAAGFDVAFVGKFVPFSELSKWFTELSEDTTVKTFEEENQEVREPTPIELAKQRARITGQPQVIPGKGYVSPAENFIPYDEDQIARYSKWFDEEGMLRNAS